METRIVPVSNKGDWCSLYKLQRRKKFWFIKWWETIYIASEKACYRKQRKLQGEVPIVKIKVEKHVIKPRSRKISKEEWEKIHFPKPKDIKITILHSKGEHQCQ